MLDDFSKLSERTLELGNHHRKYLRLLASHKDLLIQRLEESGTIDEIHFWSVAPDLSTEMDSVAGMGRDGNERLLFLGCYFAFQFLRMNIAALDALRFDISARPHRARVFRDFMLRMGNDLRRLTGCYMNKLLDEFLPAGQRPEFVICGVGTRADQDDLDLGIVDDGSDLREHFNRAIGRLQREMLRRAIPLHFHLSEHVGEQSFSASIEEYVELLESEIQDFIIITEMLGSRRILGSEQLLRRFNREVTSRYFFREGADNRFHEGYLRGMLGEVRSLLFARLQRECANPKRDSLRIIKGIINVQKVIFGIEEVNAWDILGRLIATNPQHKEVYERLDDALSFIEVFRFLYQLVQVQEEEIPLEGDGTRIQLEPIAGLMGYKDMGAVRAHDHLLVHYHEHVRTAREMAQLLLEDARLHLQRVSVFSGLLRRRAASRLEQSGGRNLAIEFVEALRFFRGTRYWDDVMGPMEKDLNLLRQFVNDFNSLGAEERRAWIHRYAKWGEVSALSVMRLLIILYNRRRQVDSLRLFHDLSRAFIERISRCADVVPRLTGLFEHFPRVVNVFIGALRDQDKQLFASIFAVPVWSEEVEKQRRKLLHFCTVHCYSSRYFKRFVQRIVDKYADYVELFSETERLRVVSKGILARYENFTTFEQKKEELGNYYDIEFLRVGLECMAGAASEKTNAEFTEFSDNYLQALVEVCKQEVAQKAGKRVRTRDLLAVYSAGGHGRKLAFDDDYDLIVLLDSDDPEIRAYSNQIFTRLNRQIVRRGTMPQYRFAEHFGEFVTSLSDLQGLFENPDEQNFIDMSQLMGARRIVGSKTFEEQFERRIVRPLILDRRHEFARQLAGEIRSRHEAVDSGVISPLNIKEAKGGLRDIELLLLILMAMVQMRHPVSQELYVPLLERMPESEDELDRIFAAFAYLKRRRDLYRLSVAAEDDLIQEEMGYMAHVLGFCDHPSCPEGRTNLVEEIQATMEETSEIVLRFLDDRGI